MISSSASSPASLWARSMTTVASPPVTGTVNRFIRPGLCSASGRNERRPSTTVSRGIPAARAAEAAASVFSTLNRDRPASVIGTSTSSTRGSGSAPGRSTETQPSMTVVARPRSSSVSRIAGEFGSREKTHGRALITLRIAKTRGSSPFSTAQPRRRVIRGTTAFTSASWSRVSIPCRPRWSALTLVTTDTSLRVSPIPLSRIPPRAVSVTANSTPGRPEHGPGAARTGVVAGLHELAVEVDPVGVRPAHHLAGGARDVGDHPAGRGLAVGAGHRDDGDLRGDRVGLRPLGGRRDPLGGAADGLLDVGTGYGVEDRRHGPPHLLRTLAVPPRIGHHDDVRVVGRTHADGQPDRPGLVGDGAHEPRHGPQREPLPEPRVRLPRPRRGQPDPTRQPLGGRGRRRRQWRDVEGELDGRTGEVEVRALEDPELDQRRHRGTLTKGAPPAPRPPRRLVVRTRVPPAAGPWVAVSLPPKPRPKRWPPHRPPKRPTGGGETPTETPTETVATSPLPQAADGWR